MISKPRSRPFGGKSQVADLVWSRFGDVRNYIEPFCFSAAMLLKRPKPGVIETVNDLNSYVANFWRAVRHDPDAVAFHADWPVNEDDLHARHRWLVKSHEATEKLAQVRADPEAYDAKIAGWWCWGACMWIGSGWCDDSHRNADSATKPDTGDARGVHRGPPEQLPDMSGDGGAFGRGVCASAGHKRLQLCNGDTSNGVGVHGSAKRPRVPSSVGGWMPGVIGNGADDPPDTHRPAITDEFTRGRGVNSNDALGTCDARRLWILDWMRRLSDRLRPVRVCCGHWLRVCDSDSTLTRLGETGVFLDPPYRKELADGTANRAAHLYANDKHQDVNALCDEVQAWCLERGTSKDIRIALCGLEGEYPEIDAAGWDKVPWKSHGGYGNRTAAGKENAKRERIWFSPACVPADRTLFCREASP